MKTRHILITALILAAASCTNTDYIDVDNVDPVLVMNAQISTANTTHSIFLSSSTLSQLKEVSGADVTVSVNGTTSLKAVEIKEEGENTYMGINSTNYQFDYAFAPGDNVIVNVKDGTAPSVDAAVTVPKDPIVKNVEILHNVPHSSSDSMFDFDYGYYDYYPAPTYEDSPYPPDAWHELRVTLQDIPSEDSFYRISVEIEYTLTDGEKIDKGTFGVWVDTSSEPVLSTVTSSGGGILEALAEESNPYNAFSDNVFKDKEYTLKLYIQENQLSRGRNYYYVYDTEWNYDEESGEYKPEPLPEGVTYSSVMRVKVYSISHDQFIYLKALGLDDLALFFSEPISIPSNVNGGMGFISIENAREFYLDY